LEAVREEDRAAAAVASAPAKRFVNFLALKSGKRGLPGDYLATHLRRATGGWPRRVGSQLFVPEGHEVRWLDDPPALFGWVHRHFRGDRVGLHPTSGVEWATGPGLLTKPEFLAVLAQTDVNYQGVEAFPHQPRLPDHY